MNEHRYEITGIPKVPITPDGILHRISKLKEIAALIILWVYPKKKYGVFYGITDKLIRKYLK
jgi:hypothetical protein